MTMMMVVMMMMRWRKRGKGDTDLAKELNLATPKVNYRTANLQSFIWYIYSTNIGTEYFKHGIYSPFFPLQNAVCFIILRYLVHVLFTFYTQGVLKLKKNNSGAKGLSWFFPSESYAVRRESHREQVLPKRHHKPTTQWSFFHHRRTLLNLSARLGAQMHFGCSFKDFDLGIPFHSCTKNVSPSQRTLLFCVTEVPRIVLFRKSAFACFIMVKVKVK